VDCECHLKAGVECSNSSSCPQCYACVNCKCKYVGCPNETTVINKATGGEPVYLKNGEYFFSSRDLLIPGRVLPVQIVRTYGSQSGHNSSFGYGWDMNYNIKVIELDPNTIILLDGENRGLKYTLDPNSDPNQPEYDPPAGCYDYMKKDANGIYTLCKKHGEQFVFDANENISSIIDRNDNSINFTYDSNQQLTAITDTLNRNISLSYDSNGLLSTITDFANRTWTYKYDSDTNDLLTVTGPNTPEHPNGLTTTYTYDSNHNLLTATDANGQTYLTNSYDSNNMIQWQTYGDANYVLTYIQESNEATVTDRRGYNTKTVYNNTGNPLSRTIYTADPNSDPNSYVTSYEYNTDMEITKRVFPAGNWIDYTYDANGNLLSICREPNTGEPNIVTRYTYEPQFNFVKTITDPRGKVTTFEYDCNGALSFNGTDDYVDCGSGPAITGTGNFTVSAWVKTDSTASGTIINQRSTSSANGSYILNILTTGHVHFEVYNGGYGFYFDSDVNNIGDGFWHHIAAVRTSTTEGEIYVDGNPAGSGSGPAKSLNNVDVAIGRWNGGGGYFDGIIDDVRVYDRAL